MGPDLRGRLARDLSGLHRTIPDRDCKLETGRHAEPWTMGTVDDPHSVRALACAAFPYQRREAMAACLGTFVHVSLDLYSITCAERLRPLSVAPERSSSAFRHGPASSPQKTPSSL
jgi:hypothetical protein